MAGRASVRFPPRSGARRCLGLYARVARAARDRVRQGELELGRSRQQEAGGRQSHTHTTNPNTAGRVRVRGGFDAIDFFQVYY